MNDVLVINGKLPNEYNMVNAEYTPACDHRMVMISSLFAKLRSGGKIHNAHAVQKSFPEFFTFFN